MNEEDYLNVLKYIIVIAASYYHYKSTNFKVRRPRRFGVRPVYKDRKIHGEYITFFNKIKENDPDLFFTYTRMCPDTFDYLLQLLKDKLKKSSPTAISPGERLALTLR